MSDYTDQQLEIAAIFGFTPDQVYHCLGPSYIEAERQAKIQYEKTKQRLIRHAEQLGYETVDGTTP